MQGVEGVIPTNQKSHTPTVKNPTGRGGSQKSERPHSQKSPQAFDFRVLRASVLSWVYRIPPQSKNGIKKATLTRSAASMY